MTDDAFRDDLLNRSLFNSSAYMRGNDTLDAVDPVEAIKRALAKLDREQESYIEVLRDALIKMELATTDEVDADPSRFGTVEGLKGFLKDLEPDDDEAWTLIITGLTPTMILLNDGRNENLERRFEEL